MKIQHVSVACWQLQTAGKGNTVGQQSLGQFIVRNVMCPMVVVSFLYTWLILGVTFILPNTFLQLSSISLIYSSRLYENFLPFTFLYTIYLFFVTLRTAFDCFCASFFKKRKKAKNPTTKPLQSLVDVLQLWAQTSASFLKFPWSYSSSLDTVSTFQSLHSCTWPLFLCPDKAVYGKKKSSQRESLESSGSSHIVNS